MRSFYTSVMLLVVSVSVIGCSSKQVSMGDTVEVRGKAVFSNGDVAKNVGLVLQPLGLGHPVNLEIKADGAFSGEVIPGKYAYYFGAPKSKQSGSLSKIGKGFQEADTKHFVMIEPGKELELKVE